MVTVPVLQGTTVKVAVSSRNQVLWALRTRGDWETKIVSGHRVQGGSHKLKCSVKA